MLYSTETKSEYYTYGLANSLKLSKENYVGGVALHEYEFFYFGFSGREERLDEHLACLKSDTNQSKKDIIKEIQEAGGEVIFVKILENVDKQTAIDKEIEQIAYHGRADLGLGPLTNRTNGGESGESGPKNDLTGQKFGRLTVISFSHMDISISKWLCKCECGTERILIGSSLKNGTTKSCGCLRKERITSSLTIHDKSRTSIHNLWVAMRQKCDNKNNKYYVDNGGRGIKVCDRWHIFENFYEDMGDKPTDIHMLSRLDNNGDFSSDNCKWISLEEHVKNRKNRRELNFDSKIHSIAEWSIISGTRPTTIQARLKRGWSHEEAVFGKNINN